MLIFRNIDIKIQNLSNLILSFRSFVFGPKRSSVWAFKPARCPQCSKFTLFAWNSLTSYLLLHSAVCKTTDVHYVCELLWREKKRGKQILTLFYQIYNQIWRDAIKNIQLKYSYIFVCNFFFINFKRK